MADYYPAIEVADIANGLIEEIHQDLVNASIVYLFRKKAPVTKGKVKLGAAKKASPIENVLADCDYIIWVAEDHWSLMDIKERRALVDHELSHCGLDEDGRHTIFDHDFTGFNAVLKRHGYWSSDLKRMRNSINQLRLPFVKKELTLVTGGK